jgi:acyl-CoA thioester hydrolase
MHPPPSRDLTNLKLLLATSAVTTDIPMHWGEMDALGHLNNVVYFRYLESARVAHLRALAFDDLRSLPHPDGGKDAARIGFILQATSARFRKPLFYPDTLRVTSRLRSIEADRFTLEHEIISTSQQLVAAVGEGTIVTYDYAAKTKVPVPPLVRERLLALAKHD